jgi:hypothetical protein
MLNDPKAVIAIKRSKGMIRKSGEEPVATMIIAINIRKKIYLLNFKPSS